MTAKTGNGIVLVAIGAVVGIVLSASFLVGADLIQPGLAVQKLAAAYQTMIP